MDTSQRREFSQQMGKSTGSYELVLTPLVFGLLGYVLDRWVGTAPLFTVLFAISAILAVSIKIYCVYKYEMEQHEANAPWAKHS